MPTFINRGVSKNTISSVQLIDYATALGIHLNIFDRVDDFRAIRPNTFSIMNLQDSTEGRGTHWVAICMNEKSVAFYCDSFGAPPTRDLEKYLLENARETFWSDTQIQPIKSTACGYYSLCFLRFMDENMTTKRFQQWLNFYDCIKQTGSDSKVFDLLNRFA